ncbi:hypothetical protein IGJ28_000326 [Enterococcus sp. AZ091]|uniref:helix-turn-helix domain-containing protein n=1 Tax=Enterococcus TaxID=1350 RepID=UPI002090C0E3|nr:helix-turn-helix transcriptional regulator [Enterococcus gallinarum]MCO5477688.1 helix-turn-helix domain-containing protein [Enterococcus gallinarum]
MITFERIRELARKQGKSLNKVEEELGYGKNVLYRLKDSKPSAERLEELANYFDVSVDYLLGREETNNLNSFFRINTSNLDPDIKEEVEEELRNYSEFLIKKALEKKAKRTK